MFLTVIKTTGNEQYQILEIIIPDEMCSLCHHKETPEVMQA